MKHDSPPTPLYFQVFIFLTNSSKILLLTFTHWASLIFSLHGKNKIAPFVPGHTSLRQSEHAFHYMPCSQDCQPVATCCPSRCPWKLCFLTPLPSPDWKNWKGVNEAVQEEGMAIWESLHWGPVFAEFYPKPCHAYSWLKPKQWPKWGVYVLLRSHLLFLPTWDMPCPPPLGVFAPPHCPVLFQHGSSLHHSTCPAVLKTYSLSQKASKPSCKQNFHGPPWQPMGPKPMVRNLIPYPPMTFNTTWLSLASRLVWEEARG